MTAWYNEIDPAAAAILTELIAQDVIAPGVVDTRSIKEIQADDLRGFDQLHFFAGGGLWSLACRMAGWADTRPIWTASCPCQPFSAAGKGQGADDPRHLWPDLYRLVSAARRAGFGPPVLMGEQVAGEAGYDWFHGVRADLAREGIAARTVDFPACAVDAPHQRNRLYWAAVGSVGLANAAGARRDAGALPGICRQAQGERPRHGEPERLHGDDRHVGLADADSGGRAGRQEGEVGSARQRTAAQRADDGSVDQVDAPRIGWGEGRAEPVVHGRWPAAASADASSVTQGDAERKGLEGFARHGDGSRRAKQDRPVAAADVAGAAGVGQADGDEPVVQGQPSAGQFPLHEQDDGPRGRNGTHWSDAEWIICHDGKARRAKPGIRLLVDGLPGRVDLWRVGGNAIVPQAAVEAIRAMMDVLDGWRAAA